MKLRFSLVTAGIATILSTSYLPNAARAQTLPQHIWIAVRTDGQPGTGTIVDPYDGSTAAKFDAILADDGKTPPNTTIHLEAGIFQTNIVSRTWRPLTGWKIIGAGMDETTVQAVGNLSGGGFYAVIGLDNGNQAAVKSDNVEIRDLTVDGNWSAIGPTAPIRNGEPSVKLGLITLMGSNNLIQRVHGRNEYGSFANGFECFGIRMAGFVDGGVVSNNIIRFCVVDNAQGNYSNAYFMGGSQNGLPGNQATNCEFNNNYAAGVNDGNGWASAKQTAMFTMFNMAGLANSKIHDNMCVDVLGIMHDDTGEETNVDIYNNKGIRCGASINSISNNPSSHVRFYNNYIELQDRNGGQGNYGVEFSGGCTDVEIFGNTFTSLSASGNLNAIYIADGTGSVTNNLVDSNIQGASGIPTTGFVVSGNRTPAGATIASLADTTTNDGLASSDVWIAIRTDNLPGSGTQTDPYDGSTWVKFDALMTSIASYTRIHLGAGTFHTAANHTWVVKTGWVVEGASMDSTTIQIVGPTSGAGIIKVLCFSSPSTSSTDWVILRDFTIDADLISLTLGNQAALNYSVGAIYIFGSNNLIENVKSLHTVGSLIHQNESFAIGLATPLGASNPSTGNVIRFCHAESPLGDYGAPFALHGCTNSSVYGNQAIGFNDGAADGFNAGGVDGIGLRDCQIYNNTFVDCLGAFYGRAGSFNNIKVFNNVVVRGWVGVAFNSVMTTQNIQISGNSFSIQNSLQAFIGSNAPLIVNVPTIAVGTSYGIVIGGGPSSNTTIFNNNLTFAGGLTGDITVSESWGIVAGPIVGGVVANNTVDSPNNVVFGAGVTFFNNRQPNGTGAPGL